MAAVHPDPGSSFAPVLPTTAAAGEASGQQPLKDRGSGSELDSAPPGDDNSPIFKIVHPGNAHEGKLSVIEVFGKRHEVCWRSLFIFPVNGCLRQKVITFVLWKWFDRFILLLIMLNSILLASYQNRANPGSAEETWNWLVDNVLDRILTILFTLEFVLKVIAWGFFLDKRSYLRELWNWLDFVVVITALVSFIPGMDSGLGFLRLFRILRPLRSLKQVPQMKVLVNTVINSIPRLANVSFMMFFFFWIFGIIGITLLDGVFYHGCRTTPAPVLSTFPNGTSCWDWPLTGDSRLCGGRYMCDAPPDGVSVGYCGGREDDPNKEVRPVFPGGRRGIPWCEEPRKIFPETDFVHFDHMGGALLTIFQCMTMEGWTDIMYYVQDGYGFWVGTIYFFTLIPITSFFLLNLALAVVDEAREDFDDEDEDGEEESKDEGEDGRLSTSSIGDEDGMEFMGEPDPNEELWLDNPVVRFLHNIAVNEIFTNFVMFFIAGNVVTMCLESYPPVVSWQETLDICEKVFLGIFCAEMVVMIGAMGPKGYVTNPVSCFDGFIVIVSLIQVGIGNAGSAFTALRTLRLFRVLNKLAHRWPSFKVLLKAMVQTGISLNYWLVLFFLFLYIWTLMWMNFFNRRFHFTDLDGFNAASADQDQAWCSGSEGESDVAYRQDCIPRAHFDTFLWAFVTIFQIMTGENWNWIMYAGMRANHWIFSATFIMLIVFGQILFLSLFLSMLMSKFNQVQDSLERRQTVVASQSQSKSSFGGNRKFVAYLSWFKKKDASEKPDRDKPQPIVPVGGDEEDDDPANRVMVKPNTESDSEDEPSLEVLPGQPEASTEQKATSPKKGDAPPKGGEVKPWQADEEDDHADEDVPTKTESRKEAFVAKDEVTEAKDSAWQADGTLKGSPKHATEEAPLSLVVPKGDEERQPWPHGYAWFVLSEWNPLRKGCRWILTKEVSIFGSDINAFDNFILLCILISTVCMALDSPLRDPGDVFTKVLRQMDFVFKIIFIVEMALKLLAMGLVWGKDAYLRSGWNWLDGLVVAVSIVGMVSSGSTGFLKTLRILRAFRPLRVISRNQNLKVVVQTIFASLPALVTLVIVCLVFLLIFALFALSYLNGTFYSCSVGATPVAFEKDLGTSTPATPLCLSPNVSAAHVHSACPRGMYRTSGNNAAWIQDNLPCPWPTDGANCAHSNADLTLAWQRVSADTPICVGRCGLHDRGNTPEWLCPRRYQTQAELPHNCQGARTLTPAELAAEQVGLDYKNAMQRALVMPCGGSGVSSVDGSYVADQAAASSCRAAFCPGEVPQEKKDSCQANCKIHPHFCVDVCTNSEDASPRCQSCRKECEAACHCDGFCEPLIKDAALCYEQGGTWRESLPQNFNNVWNSLLTLFEISSTEGWVDVMYAACDSQKPYQEPKRDHQQWIFAPFFVFYIFISFMFLLNLSVGVIVDNFIDLKESGNKVMLTPAQEKWIKSQKGLFSKAFVYNMRNLHLLPKFRRRVYDIVASKAFEAFMTAIVVVNTVVLAMKAYPWPTAWWDDVIQVLDYVFTFIFCVEFGLKFFALRSKYWSDSWNRFDFSCVVVALVGIILSVAAPELEIVGSLTQIFRIFRIARLFRLLRTMRRLNQIFMAFILSLPKLGNVLMVLLLLLILYGILGVSLFSTVKHSEWLNSHGNFMDFGWAFITLFRAVTGEAWNSIMHDLMKNEADYFREGSWCTPDDLFDTSTEESFNTLRSKCLIDQPNSCMQTMWGWNVFPAIYWVTYILFIQLMVMNLVIAVILEGYEDGKPTQESEVIDLCVQLWENHDPDHKMTLPLSKAMQFIHEVIEEYKKRCGDEKKMPAAIEGLTSHKSPSGCDLDRIPMQYAKYFQLQTSEDGRVHWLYVCKQVLRFTCTEYDDSLLKEIEDCENNMDKRMLSKLGKLESKRSKMLGFQEFAKEHGQVDLRAQVAATKLQRYFRQKPREGNSDAAGGLAPSASGHSDARATASS